jgi:hypothetical protein
MHGQWHAPFPLPPLCPVAGTPLSIAASNGAAAAVKALLQAGADPNLTSGRCVHPWVALFF